MGIDSIYSENPNALNHFRTAEIRYQNIILFWGHAPVLSLLHLG